MNINKIKKYIFELNDCKLKIKVNVGRNKYEYYEGKIANMYQNIFTIACDKGLKTFTYSDVATKAVIISKFD